MTLPTNKYMKTVFLFFLLMAYPVSGIHYSIMCVAQTQSEDEIEFKKCLTKAQAGDVDAQAKLGYCYLKGEGVAQNYEKAMEWSAKAAEQGNARGQSNLGWCYQKGYGVPQNDEKAVEWYAKAAEQGYATAQCNLGFCYERGIGIPENYEKAVEWYTKAAEQGDANGQYNLGTCYCFGKGVPQNYEKAAEWFTNAAEQGNAAAQYNLALCYYNGDGVPQSYAKAVKWYIKAAEQGDAGSQTKLGNCYYNGEGISQSYEKAAKLYLKAAEQGDEFAQLSLGYCYKEGKGVSQNYEKAVEWFTKAAEQGYRIRAEADEQAEECLEKLNSQKGVQDVLQKNKSEIVQLEDINQDSNIDIDIPTVMGENNKTFAVIIGNENYRMVPHVEYAQNDAKIFAAYCQKTLGLPARNIRSYPDATYGTMLAALKDIKDIADAYNGNIDVIFYYAGHGIPDGKGNAYLLPVDADGTQTEVCMPTSRLYQKLNELNAMKLVVFMDACFSGAQRGDGMLMAARGVAIKSVSDIPAGNSVVFCASNGEETAFPFKEKGHGMFTYFLLKKLQETKGDVTLGDLASYIVEQVCQQSVIINRKLQTPTVIPSRSISESWKNMKLK